MTAVIPLRFLLADIRDGHTGWCYRYGDPDFGDPEYVYHWMMALALSAMLMKGTYAASVEEFG